MCVCVHRRCAPTQLEAFYAALRPRWFNLLAHITASEPAVIDGDALLLDCLDSPRIDTGSAQPLVLAYLAEQVLHAFTQRGIDISVRLCL